MTDDLYTAPKADLTSLDAPVDMLASRWKRLGANLVDTLIMMLFIMPLMYFLGFFEGITAGVQPSFIASLGVGVFGILVFIVLNGKLLVNYGQTIGKRALKIRIVDIDGNPPTVNDHLIKRYAVFFLPGQVPIVGQLFSIVNVFFIFGEQKRCIHDLVAKTKVVEVDPQV